jgi:hypothetical protein
MALRARLRVDKPVGATHVASPLPASRWMPDGHRVRRPFLHAVVIGC